MAQKRSTLDGGKVSFSDEKSKYIYILDGVLHTLGYLGKESKLTKTEQSLKKLAIKDCNKVKKFLLKNTDTL